jgi:hypothetical protein
MKYLAACGVAAWLACATTNAATINLNMDGLDVMYNGMAGLVHDLNSQSNANGGNQAPAESNPLDAATFTFDDTVVEQYMVGDEIYGDLLIKNLPSSITAPDLDSTPPGPVTFVLGDNDLSFGFEWFLREAGSTVSSLALDFDTAVVTLTDTGADDPTITISASTTQWSAFNMPAGLEFIPGTRLRFSYTSQNTAAAPTNDDTYTVVFGMKGVASISGEAIPEPATGYLLLASLGTAAMAVRWRLG